MIRDCPNCRYHPTRPGGNLCDHPEQGHRGFWADAATDNGCPWFEPSDKAKGHEQIPLFETESEMEESA